MVISEGSTSKTLFEVCDSMSMPASDMARMARLRVFDYACQCRRACSVLIEDTHGLTVAGSDPALMTVTEGGHMLRASPSAI